MKKNIKKGVVLTASAFFIILGIAGLVLPFLQGTIFLIIGFLLFSLYYPDSRLWINKHIEKYPHFLTVVEKIEKWLVKFIGEI